MGQSLPDQVVESARIALEAMDSHPRHHLLPVYRRGIYESIDRVSGLKSHPIKIRLGILAVKRVASYWKVPLFMYSEEDEDYEYWLHIPGHLIKTTEEIIAGIADQDKATKEAQHLFEVASFTGQTQDSPYYYEWCVFESGLICMWDVLKADADNILNTRVRLTELTTDDEIRHREDAVMWACRAYSGGKWTPEEPAKWVYDENQNRWLTSDRNWYFGPYGEWDSETDLANKRRKDFWDWWLSQALQEAWSQSQ